MRRVSNGKRRANFEQIIYNQGLVCNPTQTPDGDMSYWREWSHYDFDLGEVLRLEGHVATIFDMLVNAGDAMLADPTFLERAQIPSFTHEAIRQSWELPSGEEYGSIYSRMDLRYGGDDWGDPSLRVPQLFEVNADTPTSLLEAAYIQYCWKEDLYPGDDQWNSIFEKLVEAWKRNLTLIEEMDLGFKPTVYFAFDGAEDTGEDLMTVECLREACRQAGYETRLVRIQDLAFSDPPDCRWYDSDGNHVDVVFKLYPFEWMVHPGHFEKYGQNQRKLIFIDMVQRGPRYRATSTESYRGGTIWIEPPYKLLWSNKAVLVKLWQMYGNDPEKSQLLLPAYFEEDRPSWMGSYVRKPLLAREGANVRVVDDGKTVFETGGPYGGPYIVQRFSPLPNFPGLPDMAGDSSDNYPVLGGWVIDGVPAGLGIRESRGLITDNLSNFAPHRISRR